MAIYKLTYHKKEGSILLRQKISTRFNLDFQTSTTLKAQEISFHLMCMDKIMTKMDPLVGESI